MDSEVQMPQGDVSVIAKDKEGKILRNPFSIFDNEDSAREMTFFDPKTGEIHLRSNMVVNLGRQVLANLIGGKNYNSVTPNNDWIITKASFGTYDETPRFTDTTLSPQPRPEVFAGGENTILYDGTNSFLPINAVDYPSPFITRFEILLGSDHANDTVIREAGLWTENGTLFARKVFPAIRKRAGESLAFLWRIRF